MGQNKNEVSDYRTSDNIFLPPSSDPVLQSISERVSRLVNIPVENQEDVQILRYRKGKYYKPHYDACLDSSANCKQDRRTRGVRLSTALAYLSTTEGGETGFSNLGTQFKPKKGTLIVFEPVYKDNKGEYHHHPCSYHAAMPVISGTKYSLSVWSRDRPQRN